MQIEENSLQNRYTIGFKAGVVTKMTVMHYHNHVILRYAGEVRDLKAGVRGGMDPEVK